MRMVGVDVGGTFTDAVYYDDEITQFAWAKSPSTPTSPADGVLSAVDRTSAALPTIDRFIHGTTIGTNAILQRGGARVWVITTGGFRDTLEIARTNRTTLYEIKTLKPAPLVPRDRVLELDERLLVDGKVRRPLDVGQVHAIAERLKDEPASALAVCLLHSYINGDHEETAVRLLGEQLPGWFVCRSSEVLPEMREYERFNTAVINAYIGPLTAHYLTTLTELLRSHAYEHAVHVMTSSGGIVTAAHASRFPVRTVLSGPAGGVAAAIHLGQRLALENQITYDMGGTSTDVCLIENLAAPVTTEQTIDGLPIRTPQIEINTVGAGGGSIAWVDTGIILKVGPQSAGAVPGPACYGKGGEEPTVTDANLVLHRLPSTLELAGGAVLDEGLAEAAVSRIVKAIPELDVPRAAEGIVRIAVARMVSAIKAISVGRGHDPRDFVLTAFGGAGPLHAPLIAEELEITHVMVPMRPGNFCAFGALISDVRHDHVRSHRLELDEADVGELDRSFAAIEADAYGAMIDEGVPAERVTMARSAGMRYRGQSWDLIVSLPDDIESTGDLERLFHEAHERRFGYSAESPVQIVSLRVVAIGAVSKPQLPEWAIESPLEDALTETRSVIFGGEELPTQVYTRDLLPRNVRIDGPALIEEMGSVTLVPPGWWGEVGGLGELHLKRDES